MGAASEAGAARRGAARWRGVWSHPIVLPLPVLATAMTSRPLMMHGSACAWIGNGAAYLHGRWRWWVRRWW